MTNRAVALCTASSWMRRPKQWAVSRRRNTAAVVSSSTASVVVLKPPAVEPGEPPTSIKNIVISWLVGVISPRSTVLKPAVRGVTVWNSAAQNRSPAPSSRHWG